MDESTDRVGQLAKLLIAQNEAAAYAAGEMKVVVQALAALVRSHPDPEAFAKEMRRAWLQSESSLGEEQSDDQSRDGIESALQILEGSCSVPLNIRPPGKATPPEQ